MTDNLMHHTDATEQQSFAYLSPWAYVLKHPHLFSVLVLLTLLDSLLMSAGVLYFQKLVAEINSVATYLVLFAAFRLVYFSIKSFSIEYYKTNYRRFLKDKLSAYSIRKSAKIVDVGRISQSLSVYLAVPAIVIPSIVYAVILMHRELRAFSLSVIVFCACFFVVRWHKKNLFRNLRKLRSSNNKYVDYVSGQNVNATREKQKIALWYNRDIEFIKVDSLQGAAVSSMALVLTSAPYLYYANSPGIAIMFQLLLLNKIPAYFNLIGIYKESELALKKVCFDLSACSEKRSS